MQTVHILPIRRVRPAAAAAVVWLLLAACGQATTEPGGEAGAEPTATASPTGTATTEPAATAAPSAGTAAGGYGEAARAGQADRVIDVGVDEKLRFKPDRFEVEAGEVVTFRVRNTGDVEHEFVLGDRVAQQAMAEQMVGESSEGGGHEHAEMGNAVTVHGGETAELTWRFTRPGTVLVGCHVQGHYGAGMRGEITVS